jgi:hypothetical protein
MAMLSPRVADAAKVLKVLKVLNFSGAGEGNIFTRTFIGKARLASRPPLHPQELVLAAIGPVHVWLASTEACSLVDLDRPLVEGSHCQPEPSWRVPRAGKLQAREQEGQPESETG